MTAPARWNTVAYDADYGRPARKSWRDINWTQFQHDTEINGSRLHYVDYAAEGRRSQTFVLAHGLGGRWQHWMENIPALAEHGRVIAVDLPGFGRSQPAPGRYCIDTIADTLATLIRQLGQHKVVFLGHSLGGPLAVRFAARHPDLVTAIVLVAGTVQTFADTLGLRRVGRNLHRSPASVISTYFEVATAGLPAPGLMRKLVITNPALRRLLLWPYLHRPTALLPDSVALLVDGVGARGVLPTAAAVGRLWPDRWLTDPGVPTLAIGADHDAISPLSDLAAFLQVAPNTRAVVIEGTGHMLMLERPDAFNDEIIQFVGGLPED
ncbi:alpha/beta hydrolase [Mycolicibacterium novocastrense]|uniref:Alpha/beta hydrolase n=1 Tax=Mycolicibacterium novocastrense TaxID=59813 RepID=A0AAW5SM73_MYCNV|nr:alpha/beta hydrolase [Mycolicibacterium novocastrense]MCV7024309.1 alpha/beta hydrolase [Mycolicibacterium novocastrense]GAT06878.1 alpha/beta hydrolase fold protein [Mycolicibacterium novocastrense]